MTHLIEISEVEASVKNCLPGSIFFIKNGVYEDVELILSGNGEIHKTIRIYPETVGKVIFTGKTQIVITGKNTIIANFVFKDTSINKSIKLQGYNNRISHCVWEGLTTDVQSLIRIEGVANRFDHNIIKNIHNTKGVLVLVYRTLDDIKEDYALIDSNCFFNRTSDNQENGQEIIRIGDSKTSQSMSSKTIVYNNLFDTCNGEIESVSVKANENIIMYNTFLSCTGHLTLRHGNNSIVAKNKFDGCLCEKTGGIRVIAENHIITDNLITRINGDGNYRSAISLMCGRENTAINGYYPVKKCKLVRNIIDNCNYGIALGVTVTCGTILPSDTLIQETVIKNTDEAFSSANKVMGHDNTTWKDNLVYKSVLGMEEEKSGLRITDQNVNYDETTYGASDYGLGKCLEIDEMDLSIPELFEYLRDSINDVP